MSPPKGDAAAELAALELVAKALANASRRHVLLVLRFRGGSMSAGQIAERFSCSWPATTRHLRVLREAGLIRLERRGRERYYQLEPERLEVLQRWLGWLVASDSPQ